MKTTPVVIALLLASASGDTAGAQDRLDALRALAQRAVEPRVAAAIHALVDGEVLESLEAGGPFASEAFIQERLDGFTAAWGGARFSVRGLRGALIGVYAGAGLGGSGSVRVFSLRAGRPTLGATLTEEGEPELHDWPSAPDGRPQVAVAWHGAAASPGGRPLRVQVWRVADGALAPAWRTEDLFPDGLVASALRVEGGEVTIRYEARYAGRTPGCDGQTEHEDVYRQEPQAPGLRLVRRRVIAGWHRELHEAVARFFAAIERHDGSALAGLVPDPTLRRRLPRALSPEPACDMRVAEPPGTVSVAATEGRSAGPVPWSLRWRRQAAGWRMVGADPVLE